MTDRELLELAAKAAGIALDEDCQNPRYRQAHEVLPEWVYWNPLADDGDALRLAVDLRMMLDNIHQGYQAGCVVATNGDVCVYEARNPDPHSATRRAIVRAAAEIGRNI